MGLSGTSSSLGHCPLPVPQALSSALETRGQAGAVKAAGMKGHQGQFTLGFLYFQKEAPFQEEGYCMFCLQFTILWSHWNQGLGARPSWFADQFCHSPAEGPWPSDGNSMSLSLIVCLVIQRLNRFLLQQSFLGPLMLPLNMEMSTLSPQEMVRVTCPKYFTMEYFSFLFSERLTGLTFWATHLGNAAIWECSRYLLLILGNVCSSGTFCVLYVSYI